MFLLRKVRSINCNKIYMCVKYISVSQPHQRKFRHINEVIPKNALNDYQNNMLQTEKGKVYDTRPFKLLLKKDKIYAWCACGHSKSQPICDCTHKIEELNIKMRPIFFKVEETKEYWLCNCKQTAHRPFCDGTHIPLDEEQRRIEKEKAEKAAKASES